MAVPPLNDQSRDPRHLALRRSVSVLIARHKIAKSFNAFEERCNFSVASAAELTRRSGGEWPRKNCSRSSNALNDFAILCLAIRTLTDCGARDGAIAGLIVQRWDGH